MDEFICYIQDGRTHHPSILTFIRPPSHQSMHYSLVLLPRFAVAIYWHGGWTEWQIREAYRTMCHPSTCFIHIVEHPTPCLVSFSSRRVSSSVAKIPWTQHCDPAHHCKRTRLAAEFCFSSNFVLFFFCRVRPSFWWASGFCLCRGRGGDGGQRRRCWQWSYRGYGRRSRG